MVETDECRADDVRREVVRLRRRLDRQILVNQARGLLMGHCGISAGGADEHLVAWADVHGVSVEQVARAVTAAVGGRSVAGTGLPALEFPDPSRTHSSGPADSGRRRLSALIESLDESR